MWSKIFEDVRDDADFMASAMIAITIVHSSAASSARELAQSGGYACDTLLSLAVYVQLSSPYGRAQRPYVPYGRAQRPHGHR